MYKKLSLSITVLAIVLFLGSHNHGLSQTTPLPVKMELLKELVVVMKVKENTIQGQETALNQFARMMRAQSKMSSSTLSSTDKERIKTHSDRVTNIMKVVNERIKRRIDIGKLGEEHAIVFYNNYYTEDEIRDLIAFYKSSAGQKSLQILPLLQQETSNMVEQQVLPTMKNVIDEVLREEAQKQKP